MPLEIDSSTKPVVNARSNVNQARRSRADNQMASDADFYAELLRFQIPEVEPPVQSSGSEPSPETPVESRAKPQETGEGEADDSREPEQTETTDSDSQATVATTVVTQSDRILDQDPSVKDKKSKQVLTDESSGDQKDPKFKDEQARVTVSTDAESRQGVKQDTNAANEGNANQKKTQVIANRNDDQDLKRQGAKQQQTRNNEAAPPVTQTADRKSDDRATSDTTSRKSPAESEAKTSQVIDQSTKNRGMETEEKVNLRVSDKKRSEIPSGSNTQGTLNVQSTRVEAGIAPRTHAKQDKNSEGPTAPISETNATSEPSRTKRKSDRNGSRNRGFNDPAREPSDRPISADRSPSSRVESASATNARDVASSRSTDPAALPASSVSALNASSTTSATTALSAPVATTAFAPTSPSLGTTDTRSARASSQSDSISQGSPAVSSTTASTPETSAARGPSGTTGSAGPRLSQYQETKLVQRVLRGMEQLANGGGQVRLRLHPPELGSLQMSLRIEGSAVFAEMKVETTSARDALMKNLPVLKERLAEQGMNVQHFDVRADGNFDGGNFSASSQSNQSGSDSNSGRQTSRAVTELQNRLPTQPVGAGVEAGPRWIRTHGQLDFQA